MTTSTPEPPEPTGPAPAPAVPPVAPSPAPPGDGGQFPSRGRGFRGSRRSPSGPRFGPELRKEVLVSLAVAVVVTLVGIPFGCVWYVLAPKVEIVMGSNGPRPLEAEPEGYVGDEAWFVMLGAGLGVLLALGAWLLLRRYRGPVLLAGLAVGTVACSVVAAYLGHRIGLARYEDLLDNAAVNQHFFRPVNVRGDYVGLWLGFLPRVQGSVLVPAIAAVLTYSLAASFAVNPDLSPVHEEPVEWDGPLDGPYAPTKLADADRPPS